MTVTQGGAIHGNDFRAVASKPVPADPRLGRVDRLVVVSARPDLPPWIRTWCRSTGRIFSVHRVPAAVPGHPWPSVHLLSEITDLLADPVLVIQPGAAGTGLSEVTVALHDLPDDAPVLAAAADVARYLSRPVVLTHGLPVSFAERSVGLRPALQHGRRLLGAAARRLGADAPDIRVMTRLVRAHPHELVGVDLDTGLLVIGGPRRDGVDDLGLVTRAALHHATCPVLVVPR